MILSALAGLFLVSATAPAAPPTDPKPPVAQATVSKTALWKISDADTTIYLFGTIHILKPGTSWLGGPIKSAFDRADELVLEMPEPDPAEANRLTMTMAVDPDGPALTQKLTRKDAALYEVALKKLGLEPRPLEQFEPWFVATLMSIVPLQALGYDGSSGAEKILSNHAKAAGKAISGLETLEEQLGFFDSLPEEAQIALLNDSVRESGTIEAFAERMTADWLAGRVDHLAATMNEGMMKNPALQKALLTDRNQRWADWVARRLDRPGTVFLAVGAAHLAGQDSVQAMLARKKLTAVRIN